MIKPVVDFFGDAQYARLRRRLFYLVLVLIVAADFWFPATTPNTCGSACRAGRRRTASAPACCSSSFPSFSAIAPG